MVAVIKSGKSLHRIFNYNEHKVKAGLATCLLAGNYPMEATEMGLHQKLNRLLHQAALNENVKRNSIHISLNFAVGEQLPDATLTDLAVAYMQLIGFGEQPYLVYKHEDAAHPHIHIVTTNIKPDGSRIDTQNIGRNQSEAARKILEKKYGLVAAEGRGRTRTEGQKPLAEKVAYGKTQTKRAITNVLDEVLKSYRYTSLPELNAVLKSYHILADRGTESSRIYRYEGLYYHILDQEGNKIGVPVKASSIYSNPGMKFLKQRFRINEITRKPFKESLRNRLQKVMEEQPTSKGEWTALLKKEGIVPVFRTNKEGMTYGLTYVDGQHKCVFNGSALGKMYSAKAVMAQLEKEILEPRQQRNIFIGASSEILESPGFSPHSTSLLESLLQAENSYDPVPYPLKRSRKKRRKKRRTPHLS